MILRNKAHPPTIYCTAKRKDGLYDAILPRPSLAKVNVTNADQLEIMALHRSCTMGRVIAMGLGESVRASDLSDFKCAACMKGKGMQLPSNNNDPDIKRASRLLEQISVDIWGPCRVPSAGGAVYFVTIIDDYSRFLKIAPLKAKSEVFGAIRTIINKGENQLDGDQIR